MVQLVRVQSGTVSKVGQKSAKTFLKLAKSLQKNFHISNSSQDPKLIFQQVESCLIHNNLCKVHNSFTAIYSPNLFLMEQHGSGQPLMSWSLLLKKLKVDFLIGTHGVSPGFLKEYSQASGWYSNVLKSDQISLVFPRSWQGLACEIRKL